jgi:hypothetical protein
MSIPRLTVKSDGQKPRNLRHESLTLHGALRLFEGGTLPALASEVLFRHFSPKLSVLLNQRLHALRLPSRIVGISTFLGSSSRP